MARATTSLPTPLSPINSTVAFVVATWATRWRTARIAVPVGTSSWLRLTLQILEAVVQVANPVRFRALVLAALVPDAMGLVQPAAIAVVGALDALLDMLHRAGHVVRAAAEAQLD